MPQRHWRLQVTVSYHTGIVYQQGLALTGQLYLTLRQISLFLVIDYSGVLNIILLQLIKRTTIILQMQFLNNSEADQEEMSCYAPTHGVHAQLYKCA